MTPGSRLGPYEIVGALGAGGMGEVFKATDTRLSRTVAIKVLPQHWVADADMKQRFEREAQTIASLKHPNICVLHDIGRLRPDGAPASQGEIDFLVMEFLDGETLAERIRKGPLPLDEALDIAVAIADALDKAHRQHVVHRDLKPSNVMLTESGPKLLDFGLAKTNAGPDGGVAAGKSGLTTPGMLVGTLQYMAPEQLEGGEADARTDIFALGVLIHEMVTGKKVFEGKSRVLLMSAIATAEPRPLSAVEPATPPALEHVVRTCLAKDPADRWQTTRDLLAELRAIAAGADDGFQSAARARRKPRLMVRAMAAAALVVGAVAAVPAYLQLRGDPPRQPLRFRVPIQLSAQTAALVPAAVAAGSGGWFRPEAFAVSPDGRTMTIVARSSGSEPWLLYVRPVGGVAPQLMPGTEDADQAFWSADGRSIAFVAGGKLKKLPASGGPPEDLCTVQSFAGGAWNSAGVILFGSNQGLYRVPAEGGTPELVAPLAAQESGHLWPHFLPDGRRYLYTVWGPPETRGIYLGSLDSKEKTRVLAVESNAFYVTDPATNDGYLVFHRGEVVYAQPLDPATSALSGEAARLADDVTYVPGDGRGHFSASRTGTLAYFQNSGASAAGGPQSEASAWHLAWTNLTGQVTGTPGSAGVLRGVELGPDKARVAVHRHEQDGGDIWVFEPTGAETRLTWDASQHNASPVWSPDGASIVFSSTRNGKAGLYRKPSDGSGLEELLFESETPKAPMSWRGDFIVFGVQDPKTGADLWMYNVVDKKARVFLATPYTETHAQVSPDGRWIAYSSNQVGGRREIHVKEFPSGGGHYQPSNAGGDWPRWRGDSKELFYHSIGPSANPSVASAPAPFGPLYSVQVSVKGAAFVSTPPVEVVTLRATGFPHAGIEYHTYDVHPDGKSFLYLQLMPAPTTAAAVGPDPPSGLIVAMHWFGSSGKQ